METDYSTLTREAFEREVKKFVLYNLMADIQGGTEQIGEDDEA